jgi:TolB protein
MHRNYYFNFFKSLLLAVLFSNSQWALAQVEVDITGDEGLRIPITILKFEGEGPDELNVSDIIRDDLAKTGLFSVGGGNDSWGVVSDVDLDSYPKWKEREVRNLVVAKAEIAKDGLLEVRLKLFDVPNESHIFTLTIAKKPEKIRQIAHEFSDFIYKKLTGGRGIFQTKIAFVKRYENSFSLYLSDYDGFNAIELFTSREPIMSPVWSPDGRSLAFVTFLNRRPAVYTLKLNKKGNGVDVPATVIGPFGGGKSTPASNSAPAWSNDGRSIAISIAEGGVSDIHLVSLDDLSMAPLTDSRSIDTEVSFSADGKSILFTSDRGGNPQIYRATVDGKYPKRVSFAGRYNASPRFSPDGMFFAFIHYDRGMFNVAVQDIESGVVQILSSGQLDQSPSVSPNGKMIVYASERNGRGILRFVSRNGRAKAFFEIPNGDVREPAWRPFLDE